MSRVTVFAASPSALPKRKRVREMGYRLHDDARTGEKGFRRIERGFSTCPNSTAMREHFLARGEPETAGRFRPSSMEFMRALGGDPLTLVSEIPHFLWEQPFDPREASALASQRAAGAIRPMPIRDQMRLQIEFLNAGLAAVSPALCKERESCRNTG